ncbi:hypothetical protein ACFOG5_06075 [Pedobacter fastidiosus]
MARSTATCRKPEPLFPTKVRTVRQLHQALKEGHQSGSSKKPIFPYV